MSAPDAVFAYNAVGELVGVVGMDEIRQLFTGLPAAPLADVLLSGEPLDIEVLAALVTQINDRGA